MCVAGSLGRATIICPGVPGQFPSIHANVNTHCSVMSAGLFEQAHTSPSCCIPCHNTIATTSPALTLHRVQTCVSIVPLSSRIPDYGKRDCNFTDFVADFGVLLFRSSTLTFLGFIDYATARLSIICQYAYYNVEYMSCIRRVPMLVLVCVSNCA